MRSMERETAIKCIAMHTATVVTHDTYDVLHENLLERVKVNV